MPNLSDPGCTLRTMTDHRRQHPGITPLTIQRARSLGWRLLKQAPTRRESGRIRGQRFELSGPDGRELVYEVDATGAMYAHATTCDATDGPIRLLHSEADVARVLADPSTEPTWAPEARVTASALARSRAAARQ